MKLKPSKLPSLPPSGDKYWDKADKESVELNRVPECEHFFEHKTAQEVECHNCHIGFYLKASFFLKGGHIYDGERFVI